MTANPYKVKAAFLRNFAHYVNWPNDALRRSGSLWNICILGQAPFGEVLEATFKLTIPAQMLEVSSDVLENGEIRKMR